MEFEGVVYKIMPVTRGTSARGEWQRQDVVFDYNDGAQFGHVALLVEKRHADFAGELPAVVVDRKSVV